MEINAKTSVDFFFNLKITEEEMRALDALSGYNFKEFNTVFKEHLGAHYIEPYEKDLESLFDKINKMRPQLKLIDTLKNDAMDLAKKYI